MSENRNIPIALLTVALLGLPGFAIAGPPPANDTCAGAFPLTLNRTTKGTTVDAADDYQTPATTACYSGSGQIATTAPGRDVVFKFTPPVTGTYSFRIVQQHPLEAIRLQNAVLYVADPDAGDGGCPAVPGTVSCLRGANRPQSSTLASSNGLGNNQSEEIDCIALDSLKTYYVYVDDGKAGNAGSELSLEPIACTSEVEPNGTPESANPYVCGLLGRSDVAPTAHCHLGTRDGAACTRSTALDPSFPDSNMRCSLLPSKACTPDAGGGSDCAPGEGYCQQLTDLDCDPRCDVGPNAGKACATQAFCNPVGFSGATCTGSCEPDSICIAGTNAGNPCTPVCSGGSFPGRYCSTLSGCPGGVCSASAQCPGGTCSRQFNEGDEDFFSLGAPPAGSKVFAALDAKSSNDSDWRMRITTTTSTLQFDDDDGIIRNGANAPEIAGAVTDGTDTFIKVSRTGPRTSEPYEIYGIVRPPLASAQLEAELGPHGNDITYGWPGDVVNANYAGSGGYVRGTFDFSRGEFASQDSDCFKFLVNEGDLMDWFGDGNPGRVAGNVALVNLPHPVLYDAEPAGIANFIFPASARKNTLANLPSAGLSGLTPAVTSSYLQWRASYTGMLEVCFYDASAALGQGSPTRPSAWAGSLSVNCGPLQPAGPGTTTADVSIVQTGPAGPTQTGQLVSYTFVVTNHGSEIAQEVRWTDSLPPELAFVSVIVDDGFGGNNTVCVDLPTQETSDVPIDCINTSMAPGSVTTYTLTVQVKNCIGAGHDVTNTASIATVSTDPNAANDQSTVSSTTVEDGSCADLACDGLTCVPNLCTGSDYCDAGVCISLPVDCDDNNLCTDDSCDPSVGCINDSSQVGDCCDDFNPCTANACDPILFCVFPPMPAGTPCDDYFSCTTSDACNGYGNCYGTTTCDDGDFCTEDYCDDFGGCYFEPVNCDDSNNCTQDSCIPLLGCRHVSCDDHNACTDDSCTPGGCVYANNVNVCNDGSVCTTNDQCSGGSCVGTPLPACDDGNPCTSDSCNAVSGCVYVPLSCDDGDACTSDACALVGACHHTPVSCFDEDSCTIDSCQSFGGCQHAPADCDEDTIEGVGGGQTVTTDPEGDGSTPGDPVETSVTTPNGGTVTIEESQATTTPPDGLSLLDLQIHVTAPPATAEDPVRLVFRVDASVLPPGFDVGTLVVFKNGVAVAACTGAPGVASPDPCVASQAILPGGDLEVVLLTSTLSVFNFGFPDCQSPSDVTGVTIGSNKDTLTWSPTGGTGARYDVVRGEVDQLPAGSGAFEACVDLEVAGTATTDLNRPSAGTSFWYLVRARNACGVGGYGTRSNGTARTVAECP